MAIPQFETIFSLENLYQSFLEFRKGKKFKADVTEFSVQLGKNLPSLYKDLISGSYHHGGYQHFKVYDPKLRDIHKASVRDRIIHHALYRSLYPYFDRLFIYDSYSCRLNKGVHRALRRYEEFGRKTSVNDSKTIWVLKGDIKKCFASIDHNILKIILQRQINCVKTRHIIDLIIGSFTSTNLDVGIPLGNLTSQLFINIYLNEFDQFIKRTLKIKYYIRYADDFVILSKDKNWLINLIPQLEDFLIRELKLIMHPDKISIRSFASGNDFLGWIHFANHRVLRTKTKKRMRRRITNDPNDATLASYRGLLSHGNAYKLSQSLQMNTNELI